MKFEHLQGSIVAMVTPFREDGSVSFDVLPELLERQVQASVYWEDTVRAMERDGSDTVLEIGPGKTLSGFFKKTAPAIRPHHIATADDFAAFVAAWKGETI